MQRLMIAGAAAVVLTTASPAAAQTKTIPGKTEVLTATVEAVDFGSRQVTVKKPDGNHEVFYVPSEVKRLEALKVGDTIRARYYENVVLRVKPAGEADVDENSRAAVPANEGTAGRAGTASHQRTITATITAIDPSVPSITFSGPNGWKYSSRVQDTAALAKVKVGDKVDITWTEAMLVSLEPEK